MRYASASIVGVAVGLAFVLAAPMVASAQQAGAIEGFGGVSLGTTSFSAQPSVGGTVSYSLTPNVQIVGEMGRIGNVLPSLADSLFSLSGAGVRVSALYGEGGVRFVGAPSASVSPYVEATAGVARLDISTTQFGVLGNGIASAALGLIGRTAPVAGVGTGLLFHTGPVVFDAGYRYKQVFAPEPLQTVLGLGQDLRAHQVRVGIGVRF